MSIIYGIFKRIIKKLIDTENRLLVARGGVCGVQKMCKESQKVQCWAIKWMSHVDVMCSIKI